MEAERIPLMTKADTIIMPKPYVLVVPTYGDKNMKNFVPRQVKKFLAQQQNVDLLRGVIGTGNINFGNEYAIAGDIISQRFQVPLLYRFELMGTPHDHENIKHGLEQFWRNQ